MATTAPTRENAIPDGIDPALVLDYDYYTDARFNAPGGIPEAMARLRDIAPDAFWSTQQGGFWVIQGYDAIVDAAKRSDLFSSAEMQLPRRFDLPERPKAAPLNYDPPNHAALRAPLNKAFTPSQMMRREGQIRELAVELIDAIAQDGEADIFAAVTERMPVLIFIDLMGLDRADFRVYRDLAKVVVSGPDQDVRIEAINEAMVLLAEVIARRRAEPHDDLISFLLELDIEGEPVSDALVLEYCKLLFFAGLDTVANAMTFALHYLAQDQDLQQRLRENPDKIPHAMEELLRRHAVAPVLRLIMKDECWRGFNLRAGDMAVLNYPVANLDERVFPHGDEVDVDRGRINHIAFGSGVHRCLGRHLARIEIVVLLEEMLSRLPTFSLVPGKPVPMMGGGVLSIGELWLQWDNTAA